MMFRVLLRALLAEKIGHKGIKREISSRKDRDLSAQVVRLLRCSDELSEIGYR